MKRPKNRFVKFGLYLGGILLIGVLSIFGFLVFQIRTTLSMFSKTQNSLESAQGKSTPFHFRFLPRSEVANVPIAKANHENLADPKMNRSFLPHKLQKKSAFRLDGLLAVLNSELGKLNLCEIDCRDLKRIIDTIRDYNNGHLGKDPKEDPAFQLALRMNQAAFGPTGRQAFSLLYQLQNDPSSLKTIAKLGQWLWHLDEIVQTMSSRGNTRALESDSLMNLLVHESNSCEMNQWSQNCVVLENEIHSWISEGALQ